MASRCETFFVVLTFLGYIAAAILIGAGVTQHFTIVPGIALAIGLTASLIPMLMLCRWAQAYARDPPRRAGRTSPAVTTDAMPILLPCWPTATPRVDSRGSTVRDRRPPRPRNLA